MSDMTDVLVVAGIRNGIVLFESDIEVLAAALSAAGFGPVREAWDEGYTTGNAHNGRRDANPYREAS